MLYYPALDLIFRALADPTRRWIFECLCDEESSVTALTEPLPMSMQAVLQHLRVLEQGRLICTEKTGPVRLCRVEPDVFSLLERWLREQRGYWERSQSPRT